MGREAHTRRSARRAACANKGKQASVEATVRPSARSINGRVNGRIVVFVGSICSRFVQGTGNVSFRAQKRSFKRDAMDRNLLYTLPGGVPRIRLQIASRAILMLLNEPNK